MDFSEKEVLETKEQMLWNQWISQYTRVRQSYKIFLKRKKPIFFKPKHRKTDLIHFSLLGLAFLCHFLRSTDQISICRSKNGRSVRYGANTNNHSTLEPEAARFYI